MKTSDIKTKDAAGHRCNAEKRNYKPKTAGNKSFRLHNSMRFTRTEAQKKLGKSNKLSSS